MKEFEIIDSIINFIKKSDTEKLLTQNGDIIAANDFTEDRKSFMVVVGCSDCTQLYPNLPDYEYKILIVVDTFIADDEEGKIANKLTKLVFDSLQSCVNKDIKLSDVFDELPVVGFLQNGIAHTNSGESNRYEIQYLVYISE